MKGRMIVYVIGVLFLVSFSIRYVVLDERESIHNQQEKSGTVDAYEEGTVDTTSVEYIDATLADPRKRRTGADELTTNVSKEDLNSIYFQENFEYKKNSDGTVTIKRKD